MSTGWERATKMMAAVALVAAGALSIGCGPAPGYEPEARVPVGYEPVGDTTLEQYPQPASSEELEAQAAQRQDDEVDVGAQTDEYSDTDPSALTEFKPALEGHGQWVDDPTYGTVWVPNESEVGSDFVPYDTAGHWTYSDDTNYVWVSDYSWGWAPFHYGRWTRVGHYGWAWIPGRTYSGAWVTWRTGGAGYDYVGWAPAGPAWYWYNGYAVGWTFGYDPYYSYCRRDYLYNPHVGRYSYGGRDPRAREAEAHTRPYVAARPVVGGGGRVAASPTVGGGGRVAASPTVGGRIAATPGVGPRPSDLGIRTGVVAPPAEHAGLTRARALSSPTTAVARGAAPPATLRRRSSNIDAVVTAPHARAYDAPRSPMMSNRIEPAARAPQVQGVAPVPRPVPFDARSSAASRSAFGPPSPTARPSPSYSAPSAPSYRSAPTPSYRSAPTPSYRSAPTPSYRSAPSFRSAPTPSYRSAPSFRSAPRPSVSRPSRSAPVRSAPSRPATRSRR